MVMMNPEAYKSITKISRACDEHGLFYDCPMESAQTLLTVWKDARKKEELLKLLFTADGNVTGHIEKYAITHRHGVDKTNIVGLAIATVESFGTGATGNDTLHGLTRR